MRRMRGLIARLGLLVIAPSVWACTIAKDTVGTQVSGVEVHAILDPGVLSQVVLVERSLNGTVAVHSSRYDVLDPINTGGGVPLSGATVSITGPSGTFQGAELHYSGKSATYGAGRYVIALNAGSAIKPGARYILRIVAVDGTVVTGSTTVPMATAVTPATALTPFNRDTDTLRLSWNATESMRSYGVNVDTPYGAFFLFTDSTHFVLPGELRNIFTTDLVRAFIPGFRQSVTIYAADTNYYNYYRTQNDPFTGSGIINSLTGGVGVFGALVVIGSQTVDVTQQPREPAFEGDYEVVQAPASTRTTLDVLHLYVETPGEPAALSGWYMRDRTSGVKAGMDGTRINGTITLNLMQNQDANETSAVFTGQQSGDSLIGGYNGVVGRVVLRRRT